MRFLKIVMLLGIFFLAACSGQSAAPTNAPNVVPPVQTGANFSIQITGDVNASLSEASDTVEFFKIPNEGDGYTLSFTRGDGLLNVQILFFTPKPPEVGTYPFSLDVVDGSTMASLYDQSGGVARAFTLGAGTLTLDHAGDSYSGSFTFTSKGGEPGLQNQTITIKGNFAGISLRT